MKRKKLAHATYPLLSILLSLTLFFTGCSKETQPKKLEDVEFTVVSGPDIPKELKKLIKSRKENAFELTFSENNCLYIIKGYGKQESGGYSIKINDFYQSTDTLVFDTELFGPKTDQKKSEHPTYPYIVVKTEYREEPVIFL